MLPVACILALLRILRGQPPHDEDEDVLFDEFAVVNPDGVLRAATAVVLGSGYGESRSTRESTFRKAMDAALVEMLRDHKMQRDRQQMEAA